MTCYETLRTPAPAADAPMAHHFVKWWRNKFRNGYKKFSIGTESERTDTEELVGRASSQCSAPPDLLPSGARLQHSTAPVCSGSTPHEPTCRIPPSPNPGHGQGNDEKRPRLRFEELTCDVELQHPESSKQQPLQFSFTLYDLDGHGRMTKDDIAGIVSTIYESIGKSVTVPHYGSKTIQVRLTVVPDDGSARSTRERREARRSRRREARQTQTTSRPAPEYHPCSDDEVERLSLEEDLSSKSSCSAERKPQKRPLSCEKTRRRDHRHRREKRERKQVKKRSGSLQRRELLEIIQANMEKNRLSFQAPRKPSDPVVNEEEIASKYQKIRNRSYTVSDKPVNAFQKVKSENTAEGYLDLASGGCGGDSNLCRYDRYLHAVICSSARHAHTGYHQKQHTPRPRAHHHSPRSRSHDRAAPHASQPRVLQIIFL